MKKLDIFLILLVAIVSAFVWRGVLNQTIEGEGYYYFAPKLSFFPPDRETLPNFTFYFDNAPRIITFVMEKLYGGEMDPYMRVLFVTIILVNISIYLLTKKITRSSIIAFLSALYAGVWYKSSFQLYARGHYQWFLQRVPEIFPIFLSFFFLNKFIDSRKIKNYLLSFAFFALGLFMSHYSTFFVFFFPAFLGISAILKFKKRGGKIKLVLLSLPFILFNYYLVINSSLQSEVIRGGQGTWEFLKTWPNVAHQVLFQLVAITTPFSLLNYLADVFNQKLEVFIPRLFVPVILFYLTVFLYFWRKKLKYFNFLLALLITLVGHLFLVVSTGRLSVYNQIEEGRYYFLPGIYLGIIISTLLFLLFLNKKKGVLKSFGFLVILAIIITKVGINYKYISQRVTAKQHYFTANKLMLDYLSENKDKFESAYVFVPSPPGPNSIDFLQKFYGNRETKFVFLDVNWRQKLPKVINPTTVFVFDYSQEKPVRIVDKSKEYRKMLASPSKM